MLASEIPTKFQTPFAVSATSSYSLPVPTTQSDPTLPGLQFGWPPDNFIPEASGGVPPDGRYFNGLFNQITAWCQWFSSGAPIGYDSVYSAEIGGYPAGAWLQAAGTTTQWWVSQVDNNTSDPNTGGANWLPISFGKAGTGNPNSVVAGNAPSNGSVAQSLYWDLGSPSTGLWICTTTGNAATAVWSQVNGAGDGPFYCGVSTGSANAQSVTAPAAMVGLVAGMIVSMKAGFTNTAATTVSIGSFGSFPVRRDGLTGPIALIGREITAANTPAFLFDGSFLHLLNPALGTAAAANASAASGVVAAVTGSGAIASGNFASFSDTAGTVVDSGVSPGSINSVGFNTLYMQGLLF